MELYLDLDAFLELEKQRIRAEKQRLSTPVSTNTPDLSQPNSNINSDKSCGKDVPRSVAQQLDCKDSEELNEIKCKLSGMTALNKSVLEQKEIADEVHQNVNDPPQQPPPPSSSSSSTTTTATTTSSAFVHANNTESSVLTSAPTTAEMEQEPPTMKTLHKTAYKQKSKMTENLGDCEKEENEFNCAPTKEGVFSTSSVDKTESVSRDEKALGKGWSKIEKDMVNRKEFESTTSKTQQQSSSPNTDKGKTKKRENVDDMDQWVSDTFYSYFPGFSNEFQKRQNYLRERQLEYQQNLLKHQQQKFTRPSKFKDSKLTAEPHSISSTHSGSNTSTTDKTDLQIIVNNPNYAPKYTATAATPRPGSTRHKLLQDLRHTELSNMIAGDGVIERNRHNAEIELSRKKDYQRELMQQIEEKRRSIELLREEERRQEEALTRRLQEQLKAIQLEEDLEKERQRVEKLRFNSEQNRAMRERLLAKLENDSRLLNEQIVAKKTVASHRRAEKAEAPSELGEVVTAAVVSPKTYSTDSSNKNKVYKYFSNSARHEYRCGQPLPANVELDWDQPQSPCTPSLRAAEERECFHLSEKVCPMCEAPLKNYESCCLRCQRKLSMNLKQTNSNASAELQNGSNGNNDCRKSHAVDGNGNDNGNGDNDVLTNERSYSLVCSKCERFYSLCSNCLVKSDVCRACHRQRKVCMNCRRTLCSFCLEEIASGRDTERCHVNERPDNDDGQNKSSSLKNHDNADIDGDDEPSFQILEVKYAAQKANRDDNKASVQPPLPSTTSNVDINYNNYNNYNNKRNNNTKITSKRPPYSINIERNSIFHPSYEPTQQQLTSFEQLPIDLNTTLQTDDNSNLESIRKDTDRRLMRYLKNYGDLAKYSGRHQRSQSESHDRSTQTTPLSVARRDVVLHEEHNLSMPLLREMPRMTRKEAQTQQKSENRSKQNSLMDNLKSRWEIPAVQKYSISKSPPVLTQVGAMRKELQVERIMSDHY